MRIERATFLREVYRALARAFGASEEEARLFAEPFVQGDLYGKDTQGIACIDLVYPWIRSGAVRFGTPTETVSEGPSYALLDGNDGPGQIVATRGMDLAIRKARESTVGIVWVRNTNDFTMASAYAMRALDHDFIGLAMSNGVPLVAGWGGRDPVFNTNPLAFVIPAGKERPIIFDGAMSSVSHGHVVLSARDKESIPDDPLVGPDGVRTGDPVPLIVDPSKRGSEQLGAILPLGPKGMGWLIFVDVLAGIASGGTTAKTIPFLPTPDDPWTGGFFLMAINVGNLQPLDDFKAKVDEMIRNVKGSDLASGFEEIVLPGERAQEEYERRSREGVPVREEHWEQVLAIALEVGVDVEAIRTCAQTI